MLTELVRVIRDSPPGYSSPEKVVAATLVASADPVSTKTFRIEIDLPAEAVAVARDNTVETDEMDGTTNSGEMSDTAPRTLAPVPAPSRVDPP